MEKESPFLVLENMINTLKWRRDEERVLMERGSEGIQSRGTSPRQDHPSYTRLPFDTGLERAKAERKWPLQSG